jgi:hypothetical protein
MALNLCDLRGVSGRAEARSHGALRPYRPTERRHFRSGGLVRDGHRQKRTLAPGPARGLANRWRAGDYGGLRATIDLNGDDTPDSLINGLAPKPVCPAGGQLLAGGRINPPAAASRRESATNGRPNRQTTPAPMKLQTLKDLRVHVKWRWYPGAHGRGSSERQPARCLSAGPSWQTSAHSRRRTKSFGS